jgi:multiple sugar transport system permease protein
MTEARQIHAMKIAGAIVLVICAGLPIAWMIIVSLAKNPDFVMSARSFRPVFDNYRDVLSDPSIGMLKYLRNSLIVSLTTSVLVTAMAFLSAYSFTRMRFRFRKSIPLALLAVSMFPQISIVGYLFRVMTSLGWVNTYFALIFPYAAIVLPLAVWLMMSTLSQLPRDLERAATVDGASRLATMRLIILPVAMPGIISTLILSFILSFNEFMFALMLTTDFSARTIPVGIALFTGLHGETPYGQIMAAAVIAVLPVIILAAIFQKRIISGLAGGAIKG